MMGVNLAKDYAFGLGLMSRMVLRPRGLPGANSHF